MVVVCGAYAAYAGCGNGAVYLNCCAVGAYACGVQPAPLYGAPAIPPAGLVIVGLWIPFNDAGAEGETPV